MDITRRDGIPVTAPARTIVDLAAVAPEAVVEAAVDDARVRGLLSVVRLSRALDRSGRSGRDGAALLRKLVDARIDLAYPALKLGIEADGRRWHSAAADTERDLARSNLLVHLGWRLLRFTWTEVTRRPGDVAATVARALQAPLPFAG